MAIKITSVEDAVKDNGLKILVHGLAGAGKTVLCATTGAPTLILNVEGGLLSIKDAPDYIHVAKITSLEDFEEIRDMLKQSRKDGEQVYEWIALDSISDIAEAVLQKELAACNDPRKSYPAFQAAVIGLIKDFRNLAGYNVIMTAKQDMVKDDYTGITLRVPAMPGNKLGPAVPYLFDEVFAIYVAQDEEGEDYRVIQTSRNIMYEAKDRSGKLGMFEPPKLKKIFNKIHGIKKQVAKKEVVEKVEEPVVEDDFDVDEAIGDGAEGKGDSEITDASDENRLYYWAHHEGEIVGISNGSSEFEEVCDSNAGEEIVEIDKGEFDKLLKKGYDESA